jgi:hypothetical protein
MGKNYSKTGPGQNLLPTIKEAD